METNQDAQAYEVPDFLPPPLPAGSSNVLPMVGLGLLVAVVLGVVLFAVSQLIYVYILYNVFLGIGIGMAAGYGVRLGRFTNTSALLAMAVLTSVLAYLVYNYALYQWVLREYHGVPPGFGTFLDFRAENDTVFRGFSPGKVGNIIVWVIEAGITAFYVARGLLGAAQGVMIDAVPKPVIEFVIHLASENRETAEIEQELNRRGWSRPEDRHRAMEAAATVISMLQEEQNEKNQ